MVAAYRLFPSKLSSNPNIEKTNVVPKRQGKKQCYNIIVIAIKSVQRQQVAVIDQNHSFNKRKQYYSKPSKIKCVSSHTLLQIYHLKPEKHDKPITQLTKNLLKLKFM